MLSLAIQGLIQLASKHRSPDIPERLAKTVADLGDDGLGLIKALGRLRLGTWEFSVGNEEYAREIINRCSPKSGGWFGDKLRGAPHCLPLGEIPGEVHLLMAWEPHELAHLYLVDPEHDSITSLGLTRWWANDLWEGSVRGISREDTEELRAILGVSDWPGFSPLIPSTKDVKELEAELEHGEALIGGGHISFALDAQGKAVSVHKKGIRFINSQGKLKASNTKGQAYAGGISVDGSQGWYSSIGTKSEKARLTLIALPDGKPKRGWTLEDGKGVLTGNDRVVERVHDGLRLHRIDGDELVLLDEMTSPTLSYPSRMWPIFHGRALLVGLRNAWELYLLDGDELKVARRYRCPSPGRLEEAAVLDYGEVCYLQVGKHQFQFGFEDVRRVRFDQAWVELHPTPIDFDPATQALSTQTSWARPMPNGMFFALQAEGAGYSPALVSAGEIKHLGLGIRPSWSFGWSPDGKWLYLGRDATPLLVNTATGVTAELPEQPGKVEAPVWTRAGVIVHHATAEGFAIALYHRADGGQWELVHRSPCPKFFRLLASEKHPLVLTTLDEEGAEFPGQLFHVANDGFRILGSSHLRPRMLWDEGGTLRWMEQAVETDINHTFAVDGQRLQIRINPALWATPAGLDDAIASALTRDPLDDLNSVDRSLVLATTMRSH